MWLEMTKVPGTGPIIMSDTNKTNITGNIGVSPIAATDTTSFSLALDSGGQYPSSSQLTREAQAASYGNSFALALTKAVLNMEVADAASRIESPIPTTIEVSIS
jgi:hypothetical protein